MESESVRSLLEPKLRHYAEWRKWWPLWTGDRGAWASEAWVDRIHWSAYLLLSEIGIGLKDALGPDYMVTNALTRDLHYAAFKAKVGDAGSVFHPLPDLYQLRVLATAAQFSESIPAKLDDIVVPQLDVEGIPKAELEALNRKMERKLVQLRTDKGTLMSKLARFHQERGAARASDTPETEAELALDLTRHVGLTVERAGATKKTISNVVVKGLREEARGIVAKVRDWATPNADLRPLGQLIEDDRQLTLREEDLLVHEQPWVATEVRRLAFPFLLSYEIEACVSTENTVIKVADELVVARLPGNIDPSTLASTVARMK